MFPAPTDRPVKSDSAELKADPDAPLTALVFKTAADPYVGRLTYFRVLSGTLKADSHVWNATQRTDERIGALYLISGKNQEPVHQVVAGDIGAVAKLAETQTGDTLDGEGRRRHAAADLLPQPVLQRRRLPEDQGRPRQDGPALCTASSKRTPACASSATPTPAR